MPEKREAYIAAMGHQRALWMYRAGNFVWVALAVAAIFTFVLFITGHPSSNVVQRSLNGPLDEMWHVGFALGGSGILYGIWTYHPKAEVLGHIVFTAGLIIYSVAIIVVAGSSPSLITLIALTIASGFRIFYLLVTTPQEGHEVAEGTRHDDSR